MKGYQVAEIAAEGLQDETGLAEHFEQMYLGVARDVG